MLICCVKDVANLLTNDALDPFGKIPGFKYFAIKLSARQTVERKCEVWKNAGAGPIETAINHD